MSIKGLDVSRFQGEVDWIGAYWFCYAATAKNAAQEADSCIRTVSGYRLDYPVCYDIEQASADYVEKLGVSFTPALARELVKSFCNRIESKGYFAMFYSNQSFFNTYLGTALAKRYAFWYARYTDTFDGTDCGIWQYTSTGRVPGISGNVDLDLAYVDYPSVIRKAGLNHLSGTVPQYITYVIQPGDTLSGIAQKYGTTVNALAKLNDISDPDKIYAGRTIRVPEKPGDRIQ